jgi:hypothetical protein
VGIINGARRGFACPARFSAISLEG